MDGIVPVRPQLIEPGHQKAIALDHDLGIARFHRELEIVEIVVPGDAGKLERAFDHAQWGVPEAVHDPIAQRAVVGADAHGAAQFLAELHQRREAVFDALQLSGILLVGVFLGGKFFGVGVIARVDADDLDPFGRLHSGFRLEVNVRDNRDLAAPRS